MVMIVPGWLLMAVAVGAASVSGGAEAGETQVLFEGEPGTRFHASWRLESPQGERLGAGEWEGEIPQRYHLPAGRVIIEASQRSVEGQLTVTVIRNGNRTRSSTSGQGSTIRLTMQ